MTTQLTARGPYLKGVARRAEIVQAAAKVFAQYGYLAGSLGQIAAEVETTKATLIKFFGSKEGLLIAVLQHWAMETVAQQGNASGLAYFLSISRTMSYHLNHAGYIELFLTLCTEATDPKHPARDFITERYVDLFRHFKRNLTIAAAAGEILPMAQQQMEWEARTFMAAMDGIELQWLLDRDIDLLGLFVDHLSITVARWTGLSRQDTFRMVEESLHGLPSTKAPASISAT
jgi:AcrR family transcriptional regulator